MTRSSLNSEAAPTCCVLLLGAVPAADVMRNVNTVAVEELSPDIIAAARARRSRER